MFAHDLGSSRLEPLDTIPFVEAGRQKRAGKVAWPREADADEGCFGFAADARLSTSVSQPAAPLERLRFVPCKVRVEGGGVLEL